jgi:catechol 2,3-dioxygenase-like lactoylglutathione lyase family enzyme
MGQMCSRRASGTYSTGRSLHWVIRNSDLKPTMAFLENVFGMRALRHEENAEACAITCNGRYNNAWSKTMVGYEREDQAYCLEVTYNYGVYEYETSNALMEFGVGVPDVEKALEQSRKLGFKDSEGVITGPDGYKYRPVPKVVGRVEPFTYVKLRVSKVEKSKEFYCGLLGMKAFDTPDGPAVAYDEDQVPLLLDETDGAPAWKDWAGRHAIALPAEKVQSVYAEIEEKCPENIVHKLQKLDEKLGILYIAIVKDFDGFEQCLVSAETFDKAVTEATNYVGPDWAHRRKFIDERARWSMRGKSS